jgi:predicted lipid-binding transport protein (Tim44 family)
MRSSRARWIAATALAAAPLLVMTGCSSDDNGEDTQATAEANGGGSADELCDALDSLEDSLTFAGDPDSIEEFEQYYDDVQAAYDDVEQAAGDEYADELGAFEQALNDFGATLESEGVNPGAVVEASGELVEAGAELYAEVGECPTV